MQQNFMATGAIETTNSLVMYNNIMNKFKWGNFKTAHYLDDVSLNQFFPLIARLVSNLADNLTKEGHVDLAKNLLHKYQSEMPELIPAQEGALRRYYMAITAYNAGETAMAEKMVKQVGDYLINSLDYNYTLLKDNNLTSQNEIQFGVSILNGLVNLTKEYKNEALSNNYKAKLDVYMKEFGGLSAQD